MTSRVGGDGGAICLSSDGKIGIEFNSNRMAWAYIKLSESNGNQVRVHSGKDTSKVLSLRRYLNCRSSNTILCKIDATVNGQSILISTL
jgi:hypothetical protein